MTTVRVRDRSLSVEFLERGPPHLVSAMGVRVVFLVEGVA